MKKYLFTIKNTTKSEVIIGTDLLPFIDAIVDFSCYPTIIIITTKLIEKLHGKELLSGLKHCAIEMLYIPDGEKAKDISVAEKLYKELLRLDANRQTLLIALGGGTVSDVVGFVAATFKRGLPWICIPTTLLSQVDAGIGGKTGVNFGKLKNMIGVVYQPVSIICDVNLLKTVPPRQLTSGLSEVIKYGLIRDIPLLELLEKKDTRQLRLHELETMVTICSNLKAEIVTQDPLDKTGTRAILNFGHTIGHAVEAIEKGKMTHGEAIAIGMVGASLISEKTVGFSTVETQRIKKLFTKYALPITWKGNVHLVMEKIIHDKKSVGEKIKWVLLEKVGKPILKEVDEKKVFESLKEVAV